jgi:uncharacterized protein YceK
MKKIIIFLTVVLTGCSTIGNFYDSADACQMKGKKEGYIKPDFCGHGNYAKSHSPKRATVYDSTGKQIGTIKY